MGWGQGIIKGGSGLEGRETGIRTPDFQWSLGSLCALHGLPFSQQVLSSEFPPESSEPSEGGYSYEDLIRAARALGLRIKQQRFKNPAKDLSRLVFPLLVLTASPLGAAHFPGLVLITALADDQVVFEVAVEVVPAEAVPQ